MSAFVHRHLFAAGVVAAVFAGYVALGLMAFLALSGSPREIWRAWRTRER